MKIAADKKKHFWVGVLMGGFLQFVVWHLIWPQKVLLSTFIALGVSALVCYAFELLSFITGIGHYEFLDAVAGILGAALGIIMILIVAYFAPGIIAISK